MELAGRRVLVTGATGAIGPAVLRALHAAGASIRSVQRRHDPAGATTAELVTGDITDPATLAPAMSGVDAVVHLAGLLHLTNPSPAERARYPLVNDQGTANVVAACAAAGVRRVVYTSTIAVYGPTQRAHAPIDEEAPTRPDTPYATTKLAGEEHVRRYVVDGQPAGVVLRLSAVYGADVKGNYARLIRAIQRGLYVGVGNGANRRTLVHEDDAAAAIVLALQHPAAAGGTFNVTDGEVHEVRAVAAAIARALGRRPPRLTVPLPLARAAAAAVALPFRVAGRRPPVSTHTIDKLTEDVAVAGDRLRTTLGFTPRFGLDDGWADVVARWETRRARGGQS